MNTVPMLKKLILLSSISLVICSHTQAATFADSASTLATTDYYQPSLTTESSNTYINQVSEDAITATEGFESNPEPAIFNIDTSTQSRSFSMLLAGLSMMTFIVMRRRIKL